MARKLLQGQPHALHVRFLQHAPLSRPLLDLLPNERQRTEGRMAHQGCPYGVRASEEYLSRHDGPEEWLQAVDDDQDATRAKALRGSYSP